MNFSLGLSVVMALIGAALWYWNKNDKIRELGRLTFAAGMFAALLQFHGGIAASLFRQ